MLITYWLSAAISSGVSTACGGRTDLKVLYAERIHFRRSSSTGEVEFGKGKFRLILRPRWASEAVVTGAGDVGSPAWFIPMIVGSRGLAGPKGDDGLTKFRLGKL